MIKESGGVVNDLDGFDINNINIRASSAAINDKMIENLKNF
jgi:myo-inositol-1(or 4)-monophosphatase